MKLTVEGIADGAAIPEKFAFGVRDPESHVRNERGPRHPRGDRTRHPTISYWRMSGGFIHSKLTKPENGSSQASSL